MTMNRHESFEELISASLSGDLTPAERQRLDSHLDACPRCRGTLAAFADQRRIMTGLRHVAPPRDLGARVRTGIERGRFASLPWWRRPAVIFAGVGGGLAAVAGALLAVVLLNGSPSGPQVGNLPTATVEAAEPTETAQPSLPPVTSGTPNASPAETPAPTSAAASPTPSPITEPAPEPDVVMAVAGPVEDLSLTAVEGATGVEVALEGTEPVDGGEPQTPSGPPIVAELSPDGQWLAYMTEIGQRGANDVWATRLSSPPEPEDDEAEASPPIDSTLPIGETVHLGQTQAGSPFLERMAWSADGGRLAYTLGDPEAGEADTDVWIFETADGAVRRLTDVGNAYAASWVPDEADRPSRLWISTAGEEPVSHLLELEDEGSDAAEPIDPAVDAVAEAEGVFQPLLSPNGALAIYWRGHMSPIAGPGWVFDEDGVPYLAEHDLDGETPAFVEERRLFSDLATEGELLSSAAIAWGLDGDAYAVWHTNHSAEAEADDELYPDPARVYFGHATDPRGLTSHHAIDRADIDEDLAIVDVEVAPTGGHLLITAREPSGGILDAPRAELRLVTRHTGSRADESELLEFSDNGWVGPAVFQSNPDDGPAWDPALAP